MLSAENLIRAEIAVAFRLIAGRTTPPEIHVAFYPFTGLTHTIRIRRQQVYVRVSDILRTAPPAVCQAIAHLLVARLFGKQAAVEYQSLYRQYTLRPEVLREMELVRRRRGRKVVSEEPGQFYDLKKLFRRLNRRYFDGKLTMPLLSWSTRRTMRILGHHDDVHETIVISRSLDSDEVPEFVVEFVLYHEMLHLRHPTQIVNGRRVFHSAAFRADERRFLRYDEAVETLERMSADWRERRSGDKF